MRMLIHIVHRRHQLSAELIATYSKPRVAFRLAQEQRAESFMNGFPRPSSCVNALHYRVVSDTVV